LADAKSKNGKKRKKRKKRKNKQQRALDVLKNNQKLTKMLKNLFLNPIDVALNL
jgi:hypothetical protein